MMIAKPDTVTGFPNIEPAWAYMLQVALEKTHPVLKEALVELTLGWHPLWTECPVGNMNKCCMSLYSGMYPESSRPE
jgi:hypothetical protein